MKLEVEIGFQKTEILRETDSADSLVDFGFSFFKIGKLSREGGTMVQAVNELSRRISVDTSGIRITLQVGDLPVNLRQLPIVISQPHHLTHSSQNCGDDSTTRPTSSGLIRMLRNHATVWCGSAR